MTIVELGIDFASNTALVKLHRYIAIKYIKN